MHSNTDAASTREIAALRAQLRRERRARHHRMDVSKLAAQTSGQVTRRGVAEIIATGANAIFDSGWVIVAFVGDDDTISFVHGPDVPTAIVEAWQSAPLELSLPIADVLRGDVTHVALPSREDFAAWPVMVTEADRANMGSFFVEPVHGDARPHAVVALAWPDAHELDTSERELFDELLEAATPVFERAARTEADGEFVTSMQDWLLPTEVPEIGRLELATLYEAGHEAMKVGGDWYDVVAIGDDRSAVVIGDVVGHDVRAVAEMAGVRHVLATHLMVTGDPAESLALTDRYFNQRAANTMATALVMAFDHSTGTLELASAGHLGPIIAVPGRASEMVECGLGAPIGSGLGGHPSHRCELQPDAMVVAFTDGVVELRDETIDTSVGAFCRALDEHLATHRLDVADASGPPLESVVAMLRARVCASSGSDDAAAVVCRPR